MSRRLYLLKSLLLINCLSLFPVSVMAMDPHSPLCSPPVFYEPYTGKRVYDYAVEIQIGRDETHEFTVPDDCHEFLEYYQTRSGTWGNRVETRVTHKVAADCRLYHQLAIAGRRPEHNFVSDYDFMNALLSDLPFDLHCDAVSGSQQLAECQRVRMQSPAKTFIEFFFPDGDEYQSRDLSNCRLRNGVFRGQVVVRNGVLICEYDNRAPGFRIVAVDYADMNRDDYMDAVLRISRIGERGGKRNFRLVLTRHGADQPFQRLAELPDR